MKHERCVYLSGGMEYAPGEGADWRKELECWLKESLGHAVFNPNRESERFLKKKFPNGDFRRLKTEDIDHFTSLLKEIVDLDSKEIAERSDYVICFWDESAMLGAGTKGELTIAKFFRKPVYMVTQIEPVKIPGWVLGCTTRRFNSFDELKLCLQQLYKFD